MSMNPRSEDFERLAVRWASSSQARMFPNLVSALTAFPEMFAKDRDALPQNDYDRAFALAGRGAYILDHMVVDATNETEANKASADATAMVDEALKLNPRCHDALRIQRYLTRPTREEMLAFLLENATTVLEECLAEARLENAVPPEGHMSAGPYLRPYLRWMLDVANEQLGLGRYRASLKVCLDMLELDAEDAAGFRLVAAFDCVKLEDYEGLATLMARFPGDNNAWFELAQIFLAYKMRRFEEGEAIIRRVLKTYPRAGITLAYQDELPAGLFGHLEYAEGSDDELFVAVSEAAVILDENCGDYASPLSSWIAMNPDVEAARVVQEANEPRYRETEGGAM